MIRTHHLVTVVFVLSFSPALVRGDLIAHYTFDGGDATDDTGNGFDGIPEGDAAPAGANSGVDLTGEAFRCSGAGHIELPVDINSDVMPELTVTMWVRADSSIVGTPGLYKTFGHDDGGWDRTIGLDNRNGPFRWAAFTGGFSAGPTAVETGTPVTSEWTFLAVVWQTDEFDPSLGMVTLYANENFISEPISNTTGFTTCALGSLRPDNFNEGWRGLIDEVQIWDEALTEEEIGEIRSEIPPVEAAAPAATTLGAAAVSGDGSATLRGSIVPNGDPTTVFFEYGLTSAFGMTTPEQDVGAGFGEVVATETLTGLTPETYHYRVVAGNGIGTTMGEERTFIIPQPDAPLVYYTFDGGEPLDESGNGFDGTPEGDALAGGPGSGVNGDGEAFQFFGLGHVVVPVDINPSILPDMTVTMWVKADEFVPDAPALHKAFGHDDGGWDRCIGLDNRNGAYRWAAFKGPGLGGGITGDTTTPVTSDWTFLAAVWDTDESGNATVRVHANENNLTESITNSPSGFTTAALGSLRPDNFDEGWVGLIDEVRIYGSALSIEEVDAIRVELLEPEEDVPAVSVLPVTGLTSSSATLRARVIPNGAPTTAKFEYGETTAYGMETPEVDVGDGFAAVALEEMIGDLMQESPYHYRVVAENQNGTTMGADNSFRVPDSQVRLLYYSFDGAEAEDESGNDYHGTPEGDAFPAGAGSGHDGVGEAFQFFGVGHVVAPLDLNPTFYPDLTVTMWVKADEFSVVGTPGLYKAFGHDDGGWDRVFGLDNRGGPFRWAAFNGNGITADTGTPVTSDWTFLAAVWETAEDDTATVRFHANDLNIVEPLVNTTTANTGVSIGSLSPTNFNEGWIGLIDEVQIFGRALSVEEVEAVRTGEVEENVGPFVRGDCNDDGSTNITDGVFLLNFLFLGGPEPGCDAACDNNADGALNITTAVFIFNFLFLGGPTLIEPAPACGTSTRAEDLSIGCDVFTSCP